MIRGKGLDLEASQCCAGWGELRGAGSLSYERFGAEDWCVPKGTTWDVQHEKTTVSGGGGHEGTAFLGNPQDGVCAKIAMVPTIHLVSLLRAAQMIPSVWPMLSCFLCKRFKPIPAQ